MRLLIRLVALGSAAFLLAASTGARAAANIGQVAPSLLVKELSAAPFDLAAEHGHVVIVNFWATWCAPCRTEMPALDAFYRAHRAEGLELIGLSEDRARDRDDVVRVMQSFSYPAAMLGDASRNGFGRPNVLPVTYVVDATGVVRLALSPGKTAITEQTLNETVLPLLSK